MKARARLVDYIYAWGHSQLCTNGIKWLFVLFRLATKASQEFGLNSECINLAGPTTVELNYPDRSIAILYM